MIRAKSVSIFQRLSFLNVVNVECVFLVAHKFIVLIYSMNPIWNTRNKSTFNCFFFSDNRFYRLPDLIGTQHHAGVLWLKINRIKYIR